MESTPWLIVLIVIAFPVVFAVQWSLVVLLIGRLSGWTGLGRRYRVPTVPGGVTIGRMMLGFANYKGTARLEAGAEGLGMDIFGLFRPGHPPLRIPWSDVRYEKTERSFFLGELVQLRLGPDEVRLRIPTSIWAELSAVATRHGMVGGP